MPFRRNCSFFQQCSVSNGRATKSTTAWLLPHPDHSGPSRLTDGNWRKWALANHSCRYVPIAAGHAYRITAADPMIQPTSGVPNATGLIAVARLEGK